MREGVAHAAKLAWIAEAILQPAEKSFTEDELKAVAERVGQYARPVFELMSIGALRTNSHSIVAADTFDYTWRPLSAIPVQSATTFSTGNLRTPSDASASAYFLK